MRVPAVDLNAQYRSISAEVNDAIQTVFDSGEFILGRQLELFEQEFARYCGARHAVGVGSGTSALELALSALEVGPFHEVITVSHTFIASVFAISSVGARPVLVDVDPRTYNIEVSHVEAAITPKTRAIIPVHLYGQPADMDGLLDLARRHRILVVEDASQAHGACYRSKRVGALGDAGCFSFYPTKNLGGYGEAGMIVTNDAATAERIRLFRNHGQRTKYHHQIKSGNHRLEELQAAVLRVKLRHLDQWNNERRRAARLYDELLKGVRDLRIPEVASNLEHVYHQYVIQHPRRDALRSYLEERGVSTGLHYPVPVHLQPCYEELGMGQGSLPVTEALASRILSLPMYAELSDEQIRYVCQCVKEFGGT